MTLANFAPDLSKPRGLESLARALGISTDLFNEVICCGDPEKIYRLHKIWKRVQPKRPLSTVEILPGGIAATRLSLPSPDSYRYVWESASPALKLAHKSASAAITSYLSNRLPGFPHANAYGYVRGRSTRDHAARHLGAAEIVSADIKEFFPSISVGRVELALLNAGIHRNVAGHLARFLTIRDSLPLGLNSSPVIANLVVHPMDADFTEFAIKRGLTYTRYADDITFSGKGGLPTEREIADVLSLHQFELNSAKFRRSKRGQRHYVTGLSVDDKKWPHVPRRMKKRLRQELHFISKFGLAGHLSKLQGSSTTQHQVNRIDGLVNYVSSIEPRLADGLRSKWASICSAENVERSFEPRSYVKLRDAIWFVDEIEFRGAADEAMLGLCCVDVFGVDAVETELRDLEAEERGDAFAARDFHLHWASLNLSQREKIAKVLAPMPFRSVLVFDVMKSEGYEASYCRLLEVALDTVMRSADDAIATLVVESNRSKVSQTAIERAVASVYEGLRLRNRRRPVQPPNVSVVSKGTRQAMFIPDALLGAFSSYVQGAEDRRVFDALIFERLRPRYTLLRDLRSNAAYTARRPFRAPG